MANAKCWRHWTVAKPFARQNVQKSTPVSERVCRGAARMSFKRAIRCLEWLLSSTPCLCSSRICWLVTIHFVPNDKRNCANLFCLYLIYDYKSLAFRCSFPLIFAVQIRPIFCTFLFWSISISQYNSIIIK